MEHGAPWSPSTTLGSLSGSVLLAPDSRNVPVSLLAISELARIGASRGMIPVLRQLVYIPVLAPPRITRLPLLGGCEDDSREPQVWMWSFSMLGADSIFDEIATKSLRISINISTLPSVPNCMSALWDSLSIPSCSALAQSTHLLPIDMGRAVAGGAHLLGLYNRPKKFIEFHLLILC